jgi:hypothetical protein
MALQERANMFNVPFRWREGGLAQEIEAHRQKLSDDADA